MCGEFKNATSIYDALEDEELLEEAKRGDALSLGYLMKKYEYFVRAKARKYFLNGAEKEDVFQEGRMGLYRAVLDYNPEKSTSFKFFAEICITRHIMTAVSAQNRQKHMPMNTYLSTDKALYDSGSNWNLSNMISEGEAGDPEWIYINREQRMEFREAMKKSLSRLERNVFSLHMRGVPYAEMSEILGKGEKSIDNALQRARIKAQNYMESKLKT